MAITSRPIPRPVTPRQQLIPGPSRSPASTPALDQFAAFLGPLAGSLQNLQEIRDRGREREKARDDYRAKSYLLSQQAADQGIPLTVTETLTPLVVPSPFTPTQAETQRHALDLSMKSDPTLVGNTVGADQRLRIRTTLSGLRAGTLDELEGIGKLDEQDWTDPEVRTKFGQYLFGDAQIYEQTSPRLRESLFKASTGAFLEGIAILGERQKKKQIAMRMNNAAIMATELWETIVSNEDPTELIGSYYETATFLNREQRDEAARDSVKQLVSVFRAKIEEEPVDALEAFEETRHFVLFNGETVETALGGSQAFDKAKTYLSNAPDTAQDTMIQGHQEQFDLFLDNQNVDIENPLAVLQARDEYKREFLSEYSPTTQEDILSGLGRDSDRQIVGNLRYMISREEIGIEEAFSLMAKWHDQGYISSAQLAALASLNGARIVSARQIAAWDRFGAGLQRQVGSRVVMGTLEAQTKLRADGETPDPEVLKYIEAQLEIIDTLPGGETMPFKELVVPRLNTLKQAGLDEATGAYEQTLQNKASAWDVHTSKIRGFDNWSDTRKRDEYLIWQNRQDGGILFDDLSRDAHRTVQEWAVLNGLIPEPKEATP